jgi:hypothetical protein
MARIENGRQMLLPEALLLQNPDGEDIKWEKSEDGNSYTSSFEVKPTTDASGKKLDGYKYAYRIDVLPQIANVTVTEEIIDPEAKPAAKQTAAAETSSASNSNHKTYHKK